VQMAARLGCVILLLVAACGDGGAGTTSTTVETTATTAVTTTSVPVPPLDVAALAERIGAEWPASEGQEGGYATWECQVITAGGLTAGSVAKCNPVLTEEDIQFPVVTVLVLNDGGTFAVAEAGVYRPTLDPGYMRMDVGPGKSCADLVGDGSGLIQYDDAQLEYFGVVLYWFMQGRPGDLDPAGSGRPCECSVLPGVVDDVWSGGWFGNTSA